MHILLDPVPGHTSVTNDVKDFVSRYEENYEKVGESIGNILLHQVGTAALTGSTLQSGGCSAAMIAYKNNKTGALCTCFVCGETQNCSPCALT